MAIDVEFQNINENGSGKLFAITSNEHMPIGQLFYKVDDKNKEVDVEYIYVPRKWARQQGIKEQLFAELKASFPRYAVNLNGIKTKQSAFEKESPARSKAQFRYMQGICNGSIEPPEGMTRAKACEFVKHQKDYKELPEKASARWKTIPPGKRPNIIHEVLNEPIFLDVPEPRSEGKGKRLTPKQKAEQKAEIFAIRDRLKAEIAKRKEQMEQEGEDFVYMPVPSLAGNDENPIRRQQMSPAGTDFLRTDLDPELNELDYLGLDPKNLPKKKRRRRSSSYTHNHFSTGEPCNCTFTNHLNISRESNWQIISSKLDKIIQENPKVLRTEEGQKVLEWLKTLSEKIDPLIPWIVREYKKQRLVPLNPEDNVTQMIGGPNSPQEFGDFVLDEQTLSHWADWFESKSPTRRGVDIMSLDLQNMAEKIFEWEDELADKMEQDANSAKGEVIYKYGPPNEGWTMRNVRPEECREEGDLMGHCVGGYSNRVAGGEIKIISLRDPKNHPHATLEVFPDGRVVQIQGKQNIHPIGPYRRMVHEFITQGFENYMGTSAKPDKTVTTWENIAGEITGNPAHNDIDAILDEEVDRGLDAGGSSSLLAPLVKDPFDPKYDDLEYRHKSTHPAGYSGYDYNASHYGMDPSQVSIDYGRILRDYPRNLEFFPSSDYQGLGQVLYEAAKERGELPIFAKEFEKYNQERMEDIRHQTENDLFPSFEEGPDWTVERGKEGGWRDIFEKATGRIDPSLIYPLNSPEYKEAMLDYKRGWNDWVRSNFTGQQTWPGLGDEQEDLEEPYAVREDRANKKRQFFDLANRNTIENLLTQHRNHLGEYSNEEVNPLQRDKRGRPIIPNLDQMVINRSLVDNDESNNKVHPEQMALFSKWKISKPSLVPPDAVRSAARRGRNKKSKWQKKADWVTTDGDKKKELDPSLVESALNSYKESDVYDYYTMGFRRGIREVQSRLRGDYERGTLRQMTFDLSQEFMTKDEESDIHYVLNHNLSRFNLSVSEERMLLDIVMDKIFWPWFKKGKQDAFEKTMHLSGAERVNLWYGSDVLYGMINDGFEKEYARQKTSKWKIAAKDPSTLTEDQIITSEWANEKRIHVMWSGFKHAFSAAYSRGQVGASNPQQEKPYVKTRWDNTPPERKTPDQIIMPLINDIANMGQENDWYTGDVGIRNRFNFQTGITPSKFWGKGRKYTEEGKQFSKSNFIKMLVQDFNVFYKEGWKSGLYFGAQDYYDNNNKTRNEYIQEERKKLHEDQNYTYENYRDVSIKYMKETKEEAKKWFMEKLKEYDPDIISYVDITRLSSVKNSYFEEFNTESGSNEYGDHLLIKDPETDETIGSVYYALAPDGNGTMVYYIGYGDKLHPTNDAEEVSDIKSRYPRIGVEIFKWVRNNLPEPYYAAFANQDLKRVLRAEPTGMHSYDMVTGEPVSVDIIRRSKVERYIKKSDENSPTMTEEQLLNAVKLHGFVKGIDAAEKYFSYGPFPEEERMPKDQIFLFHYEDPQKIKDWYHQTNSRDLSAFYDYIKYIKDSVTDIAPKIDDAYITWFDQGVNYSIKNQVNKKNWPLDRTSPQEAAHIFFEQLNKTAAHYDNNDDDDFEDIPYGYLSIDDILDYYLTDADIERMKNIGLVLGIKKALKILQKEQDRPYFKVPNEQTTMSLDFITSLNLDFDTHTYMRMRDIAMDILFDIQRVSQKEVFDRTSVVVELTNKYSVPYFSVGFNEIKNLYKTNPQKIKEINPNDINSLYDFVENNLIVESKVSKWHKRNSNFKNIWELSQHFSEEPNFNSELVTNNMRKRQRSPFWRLHEDKEERMPDDQIGLIEEDIRYTPDELRNIIIDEIVHERFLNHFLHYEDELGVIFTQILTKYEKWRKDKDFPDYSAEMQQEELNNFINDKEKVIRQLQDDPRIIDEAFKIFCKQRKLTSDQKADAYIIFKEMANYYIEAFVNQEIEDWEKHVKSAMNRPPWKTSKEQLWEIVLHGTEGYDIIGTGSFEECRKKTEDWLKDFIGGYINHDTKDDAYPIPKDAKEQDKIALEELKKAEDTGRWSFYFDYDKPFDLIIQPFEKKKESKWKIAGDKKIREVMKEWQKAVEDGDAEKERQMEEEFWALRGMKKEFVEKYGPSDVRRLGKIKTSEDGYWSNPQTELAMELINSSPLTFRGGPSVKLDKIVRRGGSVQDVANFVIQNFVIPYNEDLQWRWEETNDEEDVEWQKREHRKEWKQQARKQFPFSIPKQRQYVREMEQMQYGLLGDPTPHKLEDYILDISKIDWNQIYNIIKKSMKWSKWKKTSATPFVMQVLKMHDNKYSVDQIAKTLNTSPREVKRIIQSDLRQRPYEELDIFQQYEKALMQKDEQKIKEIENKIWEKSDKYNSYDESMDRLKLLQEAMKRNDRGKEHELMKQFWSEHGMGDEYEQDVVNIKQPTQQELNTWMQEELNKIPKQ